MPDLKREPDDKEQSRRFIEKAKEVSDEDSDRLFDRTIKTIVPPKKSHPSPSSP